MTLATTLPALVCPIDALDERVRAVVVSHYDGLWRFVRRMGVAEDQVEDAVQHVLLVFARRAGGVDAGAERPFLFSTALRVASDFRRKGLRRREIPDDPALSRHPDPRPDAERQLEEKQLRLQLDRLLDELGSELRAVFVLSELEELTMAEISRLLSIPPGTVASRLRRARDLLEARAVELRASARDGAANDRA
jgi:RNA polymerase sigma-70 factor, ECF subfamily